MLARSFFNLRHGLNHCLLVGKLEEGCIFKRFYPGTFNPKWDVADSVAGGSCWQRAFATNDTSTVESICQKYGVDFEWLPSDPDNLPNLITRVHLTWYKDGCLVLQTPLLGKEAYYHIIKRNFEYQKRHLDAQGKLLFNLLGKV